MKPINVFWMLIFISGIGCLSNRISLECKVAVTLDYVFFDHCYNGLFIYELGVTDSIVDLYPSKYKKIFSYELGQTDSLRKGDTENLKIYFSRVQSGFQWKVYKYEDWGTGKYETKDTVQPFKPGKWYLFSFMNPHFEVFVHCDSSGNVSFVKKDLNANF
jgi:hypothetical protein